MYPHVNALHPPVLEKIDSKFAEIYNNYQAPHLRADQVTYAKFNANPSKFAFPVHHVSGPYPEVGSAIIYKIPVFNPESELDAEVYVPTVEAIARGGLENESKKLPVHLNFHGGGFVLGGLKSDETWCRQTCESVGCIVVNVDYRLAPEHPHPTPFNDSWAALKWTIAMADKLRIDKSRISVGGLSAGGCLAAALAIQARDDPDVPPLVLQLLIMPITDARYVPTAGSCDPKTVPYESYSKNEFAPMLPLQRLVWFYNLWLGTDEHRNENASDWRASPIAAGSHANLPPASIHLAEIDPLLSEGIAYDEVLRASGTPSKLTVYKGVGHTFTQWDGELQAAKDFVENAAMSLRKAYRL